MLGESNVHVDCAGTANGIAAQRTFGVYPVQSRGVDLRNSVQIHQPVRGECRRVEVVIARVSADVLLIAGVVSSDVRQYQVGAHEGGVAVSRRPRIGIADLQPGEYIQGKAGAPS